MSNAIGQWLLVAIGFQFGVLAVVLAQKITEWLDASAWRKRNIATQEDMVRIFNKIAAGAREQAETDMRNQERLQ